MSTLLVVVAIALFAPLVLRRPVPQKVAAPSRKRR